MGRMIGVGAAATAVFIVLVATIQVLMAGLV